MVLDLGFVSYEESFKLQKEMVRRRKLNEIEDTVIFAEHASVFTIGRMGSKDHLKIDEGLLLRDGIKVMNVDRGGDITYHGPGQLLIYPIIDLKGRWPDLHRYMHDLEEVAIQFLALYAVKGERCPGRTGVWVAGRKIASIGIGVTNWVTYHGLSINLHTDLGFFDMIYPCGLKDISMESLDRLINRKVTTSEAKSAVIPIFNSIFNCGKTVFTGEHSAV